MSIFYSDNANSDLKIDVWRMDGTKAYLRHYENYMMLDFIRKSTKDTRERAQANKELTMCEKKLAFWKRHPRYEHDDALRGVEKIKLMWEKR